MLHACLTSFTEVCRLVGTNLRRKSAHAHTFGGDFEFKILRISDRKFVPTNLQTSVARSKSGMLRQYRPFGPQRFLNYWR